MKTLDAALQYSNGIVEDNYKIEKIIKQYEQLLKDRKEKLFITRYTMDKKSEKENRKYEMKVAEIFLLEAALIDLRKRM